jgi:hypothetical protein
MKSDEGRLMMVVDYNNDVSEYWKWSAEPCFKMEDTSEGLKFGVNFANQSRVSMLTPDTRWVQASKHRQGMAASP